MSLLDTEVSLADIEAELRERTTVVAPPFADPNHPTQAAFIEAPGRLKAALCTRRAGKSIGAARYLLKVAYEHPGVECLYLALTRKSAKAILWRQLLKMNAKWGLMGIPHGNDLTLTLPNGSLIRLAGADAGPEESEKFLGVPYKLVVIDEAASFRQDLKHIVYSTLKPAMIDLRGTICMIGTPGNHTRGLFYDVTNGSKEYGDWVVHRWSAFDNPYILEELKLDLEEIDKYRPLYRETAAFKQMYLGQWVIDNSKLVYDFTVERNTFINADHTYVGKPSYILGVDLGYEDDSAFVICMYTPHDPTLYIVWAESKPHMTITDVAEKIKLLEAGITRSGGHGFDAMIIDGANKQAVEDIRRRYNLPLKAADKREKAEFIEIMNADFTMGRIKLDIEHTKKLQDEYTGLVWDEKSLKKQENPKYPNHLCDAALYSWRHCYSYLWEAAEVVPEQGSEEYWQAEARRMEEIALENYRANNPEPEDWS